MNVCYWLRELINQIWVKTLIVFIKKKSYIIHLEDKLYVYYAGYYSSLQKKYNKNYSLGLCLGGKKTGSSKEKKRYDNDDDDKNERIETITALMVVTLNNKLINCIWLNKRNPSLKTHT